MLTKFFAHEMEFNMLAGKQGKWVFDSRESRVKAQSSILHVAHEV